MQIRRMKTRWLNCIVGILILVVTSIAGRSLFATPPRCTIHLVNALPDSGISFRHQHGGDGQGYIVEGVVGGLVTFDYDRDGYIDVYFLNGATLKGTTLRTVPHNSLYHNDGDGTFTEVTEAAGVGDKGYGLGVTAGDWDNDGYPDLYVNNFGSNVLYRNNGDGTFRDITALASVRNGDKVGAGTAFLDIEGDGDLDLYVANYVDFTFDNHVSVVVDEQVFITAPGHYNPVPDTLYRNNGDGTFTDVSEAAGIAVHVGPGMGIVCGDFDDDGDADVFVCHDAKANFLFQNDGQGHFEEVGLVAGVAYDFDGTQSTSMGVDCGDVDNDGDLDLFMTDYQQELPILYRNLGGGTFEDATSWARITVDLLPHVNWGTGFGDFDNDGDRDVFIACGHFDAIENVDDRTARKIPNFLLMNTGDGKFVDVSQRAGTGMEIVESSRGIGLDDFDNDGDLDVVVSNSDALASLLRNDSPNQNPRQNHWLQVTVIGTKGNRAAVGARVRVVAGDLVQVAEVHSGRGYQSHFGTRLQFGLGDRARVDRIEIRWPKGELLGGTSGEEWESFPARAVDQHVILVEGSATPTR